MNRKEIGELIRSERKTQNLGQKELAEKCNLSRDTLLHLENGRGNIAIDGLLSILKVLGLDLDITKKRDNGPDTIIYDMSKVPIAKCSDIEVYKKPSSIYSKSMKNDLRNLHRSLGKRP